MGRPSVRTLRASGSGLVVYSYEVEFFDWNADDLNVLLWSNGGMVTVGRNLFRAEDVASDCGNAVANEWLRQNPRR